jgi:hydroxymethylpyrimidine/phosphomethylpyrimidine kinase
VTPNIPEAQVIAGMSIAGVKDMYLAAEKIHKLGVAHVVIKGGHLRDHAVDVLFDGNKFSQFRTNKIKGWFHGTGCAFSAALTAHIALGRDIHEAVKRAKAFISKAIEKSMSIGKGMSLLNV